MAQPSHTNILLNRQITKKTNNIKLTHSAKQPYIHTYLQQMMIRMEKKKQQQTDTLERTFIRFHKYI